GCILAVIALANPLPSPRQLVGCGLCTVLLPLCGANGLVLVPALGLWLTWAGVRQWRSNSARMAGIAAVAWAILAFLITGLSFIDFERASTEPADNFIGTIISASMFLSMGLGMWSEKLWPYDGIGVVLLIVITTAVMIARWVRRPSERSRLSGL